MTNLPNLLVTFSNHLYNEAQPIGPPWKGSNLSSAPALIQLQSYKTQANPDFDSASARRSVDAAGARIRTSSRLPLIPSNAQGLSSALLGRSPVAICAGAGAAACL